MKYAPQQSDAGPPPSPQVAEESTLEPPTEQAAKQGIRERLQTISLGGVHYVFLHGQQFDTLFRYRAWAAISYIRDGAEAFRLYSWLLLGFAVVWSVSLAGGAMGFAVQWSPIFILLLLGAGPRFFVWVARPLYNKAKLLHRNRL